jgi:predicted NUDIX family NTP pyrophosphohydrolase
MPKLLSCGLLLLDGEGRLLLCHATGTPRWDIPKGVADAAEAPIAAALRETEEEIGLVLEPGALVDLGRHPYLRGKDLHLFAALVERLDPRRCRCRTLMRDARGRLRPEVDAWAWVPFAEAGPRVAKGLAALLASALPLADLQAMLERRVALVGPTRWHWRDDAPE